MKTKHVKLIGGPMDGRLVEVPSSAECYPSNKKGEPIPALFAYRFAGREGRLELFARVPKSRREAKYRIWHIKQFGKDPVLQHHAYKRKPHVGRRPRKAGQGARRRAAAKAA